MSKDAVDEYHKWYYDSIVWQSVEFLGVPTYKSVSDMWNYQEILVELRPTVIVEFGTRFGGSALYFSVIGRAINQDIRVLSVDVDHQDVYGQVGLDSNVELMTASSVSKAVLSRIKQLRIEAPGPMFAILDSDHTCRHVLEEMEMLREVTLPGDYLVVEDGNINGHPVLPGWGPGPFEAIVEYQSKYPADYLADTKREKKFGFTFAPNGFLIRQ